MYFSYSDSQKTKQEKTPANQCGLYPGRRRKRQFSLTILDSHSKALELHCPGSARASHPPGSSKGCSQQDTCTQEGEGLGLVWQLSSPSEQHMGIIFSATSTWKGDMGYSLLQTVHCYHLLKVQRFWIWFLPIAVDPLRSLIGSPGKVETSLGSLEMGGWPHVSHQGRPSWQQTGKTGKRVMVLLVRSTMGVARALPPSLQSCLPQDSYHVRTQPWGWGHSCFPTWHGWDGMSWDAGKELGKHSMKVKTNLCKHLPPFWAPHKEKCCRRWVCF